MIVTKFTEVELSAILDAMNNTQIDPRLASRHAVMSVADSAALDGLCEKWEVDDRDLVEKISGLTSFQRMALEIWAAAFWIGVDGIAEDGEFEKYIAQLT